MSRSNTPQPSYNFSMPTTPSRQSLQQPVPAYVRSSSASSSNGDASGRNSPRLTRSSMIPSNRLTMQNIDEVSRYKAMTKYLYGKVSANQWMEVAGSRPLGVLLRRSRGVYVTEPAYIDPILEQAVAKLNVEVAITMSTETTQVILSLLQPDQTDIMLGDNSQLQIVDSLSDICRAGSTLVKKFQYAALIRDEQILLVWHDEIDKILLQASNVEEKLLGLIWGTSSQPFAFASKINTPMGVSPAASIYEEPLGIKGPTDTVTAVDDDEKALEEGKVPAESLDRPVIFTSSISTSLAMFLIIILLIGFPIKQLLSESLVDHQYMRWIIMLVEPIILLMTLFFGICLVGDIFRVIGPITALKQNSRFYSANKPDINRAYALGFTPPKITIQMPVYKESLKGVIIPTVTSLKAAISFYESRGGSATIFINDDGMNLISPEEQQARMDFYHDNNIGWVARPKDKSENGYIRKGKFKKASNMNFALNTSIKVEAILQRLVAEATGSTEKNFGAWIDAHDEEILYQRALAEVMKNDSNVRAAGNIRVGEIILIVDSDTEVPVDCLLYGAAEMFHSPELAIIQHSTGVMQVQHDYFENGIAFFTRVVYTSIRLAVANGEVAPFVGHNAFLRWQAVQSVAIQEGDGYMAYWSESHVSEDFDMALRLQVRGNTVRLGAYHNDEFKEGVSLHIYDELARWEKYAYGCNELVFNPMYTWPWKGPLTGLFCRFIFKSNIHLSSKLTILGYITSYYAIASSFPLTILNYFLVGWFLEDLDKVYMQSWNAFLGILVVFSLNGNICLAILRYRTKEAPLGQALVENFKWLPMMSIFFGGLSFHMNLALLAHMFSINMQWGATTKDKSESNFFQEIPKIAKTFKWMYLVLIPLIGMMIYLAQFAPLAYRINEVIAIVPMAVMIGSHALLPFVLNPSVMVFSY